MNFWKILNNRINRLPFGSVGVIIGVLFLIIGAINGQLEEIYRKAIMICLECIGIG